MRTPAIRQQIIPAVVKTLFRFVLNLGPSFTPSGPRLKHPPRGAWAEHDPSTLRFDHLYLLRYNPT